ncbi:4-hydroxy-tetrahydrodipicolinate synthase [Mycolicibacterium komossense]|uniref:4-hydroxy-tetrahydrodipicolinate synthase n=2 Tax=Mycolicibacterium komossense TaxID=1779 RepID=A0ABT3C731_9MYCO|nr:4-hydroxy-tetrahydrodipicolinate synthase [Mycolicibacterium komossense]
MSTSAPSAVELFGTNLVASVTPMRPDGSVSDAGVERLTRHLINTGCDGIVVGGTTGESPTLTEVESAALVEAVAGFAGGRARVIAGVGTYDTAASIRRAQAAEAAGADALLVVSPYYSRPTQAGVIAHFSEVADATGLPVMLYDVPARAGIALDETTLVELACHPQIRAVKDAKGDLFQAMSVMSRSPLAYFCGIDELNLAYLACGAVGIVSVVGNAVSDRNTQLIAAVRSGSVERAREIHSSLIPLIDAVMWNAQGASMAKRALVEIGLLDTATVRLPMLEPSPEDAEALARALGTLTVSA